MRSQRRIMGSGRRPLARRGRPARGRRKMATLKDVARLACVDVSTVSRALNNTGHVHPDTKERIYAAARQLGYRPNLVAQALRQGRRHTIGVVVPRLHLTIFSEIVQGVDERARELGYGTLVSNTEDDPLVEMECLTRMRSGVVDGILVAGTGRNGRHLRDIRAGGVPVVQLVRQQDRAMSGIVADYSACGYEAVRYLYSRGCRKIGLISGSQHLPPYAERASGYRRAMRELGLPEMMSASERVSNTFEYGYECMGQLLAEHPGLDGVLAAVDIQGIGAIRSLVERGVRVPEQVKVMSLTGHAVGGMLETSMTSMEMPAREMGRRAADVVVFEINAAEGKRPPAQRIVFDTVLVEREST